MLSGTTPETDTTTARRGFPANRALAVLSIFIFLNYLDRYALSILLEPMRAELRLSDTQIGLLTGAAFALLYATLALPVARIAEHRNRVHIMVAAVLVWSFATALCGLAGTFLMLFFARMLVGAGESGSMPPAQSLVADAFPLERRGTALAIFSTGGALGTALAPAIGGYLESQFGWRGAFLALGLIGIPVSLLLIFIVKDPPRGLADSAGAPAAALEPPPPFGVAMRRLLGRPAFMLLIPATVAIGLAEYSLFLWLPSYFARTFHDSAASIGSQITLYQGLPLLAGTLFGGLVVDRLVKRDRRWLAWLPMAACFIAAPTIWLIFLADTIEAAFALLVIPSLALGLYLAPTYTMIQTVAGVRSRATATAVLTFAVNILGLGLGPLMLGTLSDLLHARYGDESLRYAFFIIPPIYAFAGVMLLLVGRHLVAGIESARGEHGNASPAPSP